MWVILKTWKYKNSEVNGEKNFNQHANSSNIINWNPTATMTYVPEIPSPFLLVNHCGKKSRETGSFSSNWERSQWASLHRHFNSEEEYLHPFWCNLPKHSSLLWAELHDWGVWEGTNWIPLGWNKTRRCIPECRLKDSRDAQLLGQDCKELTVKTLDECSLCIRSSAPTISLYKSTPARSQYLETWTKLYHVKLQKKTKPHKMRCELKKPSPV